MPLRPETRRKRKNRAAPPRFRQPSPGRPTDLRGDLPAPPPADIGRRLAGAEMFNGSSYKPSPCTNRKCSWSQPGGPRRAREPDARPRSALNRFFTILCMLQYVQTPPHGSGTPPRDPMYTPSSLEPEVGGQSQGDGERQGQERRKQTQTCGVRLGQSPLKHEGARSEGSGGDRGGYIHHRLVSSNK